MASGSLYPSPTGIMKLTHQGRTFLFAIAMESMVAGIALIGGWWAGFSVWTHLAWRGNDVLLGCLSALPLFGIFLWMTVSQWPPFVRIRLLMDAGIRPFFASWSIGQLAFVSILAGVGEEALFRGLLQGGLMQKVGLFPAWLIASALFGAAHCLTGAYAITVTGVGLYLGALWVRTDNLLVPMVTHAVYDFVALVYFLKIYQPKVPSL